MLTTLQKAAFKTDWPETHKEGGQGTNNVTKTLHEVENWCACAAGRVRNSIGEGAARYRDFPGVAVGKVFCAVCKLEALSPSI